MYKNQTQRRVVALLVIFILLLSAAALAESYTATTMRLLRYEGAVEIEDEAGNPRFIMANARFNSGEAVRTGSDGRASIGLDDTKILTMDANSRVEFAKESNALRLTLTEGSLMLDVQKKLDANESLEIETATMLVGIRGTIVYVNEGVASDGTPASTLGVLEGTAQLHYVDQSGASQVMPVPAGQVAVVKADREGAAIQAPEITPVAGQDLPGFVQEALSGDDALRSRVENALDSSWRADGNWTWSGTVTLVAQSASKLYDGAPLTRTGDVLVYGLPASFSIHVTASGSQTDAGSSVNSVGSYSVYNSFGENVTSHFTSIETVSGQLVVDPAPLTVWTGSAEKVYDGEPLTNPETELSSVPGYEKNTTPWRNTSYVSGGSSGAQTLYALCGSIWVHGTNPLTGETREIQLNAGQKMEVLLNDDGSAASIELKVEPASVDEIPDDVLRVYADNPELLAQACADAGWDPEALKARISTLAQGCGTTVNKDGLKVESAAADRLMRDSTNVRITVDSDITSYNNRALGSDEARYTPVHIDADISVTATGSQTEVGESPNTYEIDWGGVNPGNYILSEELGTLTVLAPETIDDEVTLTAASASKVYDGTPLTADTVEAEGLPEGYTVEAEVTGSITDAGTAENTITAYRILDAEASDVTDQFTQLTLKPGTLTVEPLMLNCDLGGTDAIYDGRPFSPTVSITYGNGPHAGEVVVMNLAAKRYAADADVPANSAETVQRFPLFTGDVVLLTVSGGGSEVGTHTISVSLTVSEGKSTNFTPVYINIEYTIEPAELTVATGSATKAYDGQPLTNAEVTITGLAEGDAVTVTATGTLTDVGTADNTYSIDWGDTNPANYTITENLGTLEVTPSDAAVTLTAGSAEKTYDGKPLTKDSFTVTGLPEGFTVQATVTGSRTNAGNDENAITSYRILNGEADVTAFFPNVTITKGTLTVNPAPLTVTTGSANKVYDALPLTSAEASLAGLVEGDAVTVTATGTLTDVGTVDNTYSIDWGDAKASNYTITENLGTLEVTPLQLTIDLGGHTAEFDGDPQMPNGPKCDSVPSDGIRIVTDGMERDVGTQNVFTLPGGELAVTVMGFEDAGTHTLVPELEFISGKAENYDLVYENQTMIITPMKVTVQLHDGSDLTYNGVEQLGNFSATGLGFDIGWTVDGERGFTWGSDRAIVTVTGGGKDAGDYTLACSTAFESGKPGNYSISVTNTAMKIVPYAGASVTTGSASKIYDGKPLTEATATIEGLLEGDTATVTATGTLTDAGEAKNTYSVTWGENTKGTNYTLNEEGLGTLTVEQLDIRFVAEVDTDWWFYDGQYNGGGKISAYSPIPSEDYPGYSVSKVSDTVWRVYYVSDVIEATLANMEKDVGEYTLSCTMKVVSGNASNYSMRVEDMGNSNYSVVAKEVIVTTGEASKEYDGQPLTNAAATITGLIDGESATVTATGSQTDVGSSLNTYTIKWGENTKAENYSVTEHLYELVVGPHNSLVNIFAKSATKEYDGTPLTESEIGSQFIPVGLRRVGTTTGSQTNVGTSVNELTSYHIYDAGGKEVTSYFTNIQKQNGTLEVTPISTAFTIKAASSEKVYDGSLLEPGYTWEPQGEGFEVEVTCTGSIKDVGSVSNQITNYTIKKNGIDVTAGCDNVTVVPGTLTVTKAPLTITTASADKLWDDTPLTDLNYSVEGLAAGEDIVVVVTGQQTEVGSSENTYTINWSASSAKQSNYTVTSVLGTLKVTAPATSPTYGADTTMPPDGERIDDPTPTPSATVEPEPTPAPSDAVESDPTPAPDAPVPDEPDETDSVVSEPEPSDDVPDEGQIEEPASDPEPEKPDASEKPDEPEKAEGSQPEEPGAQTSKAEEDKAEAPKAETPVAAEQNAEAPKAEETRDKTPENVTAKEETPKPEASQTEPSKPEEVKTEAPKVEETSKPETSQTEPPKSQETKTEAPKVEEAPKAETPKSEEAPKAETSKVEEAPKAETPKSEEAPKAETSKVEEAPKTEAPQTEPPKSDAPKAEAPKVEEAPKTEAPQTEPPKTDAPKAEAPKVEAPSVEEPSGES